MNLDNSGGARRIWLCIGAIDDLFLEEAEAADIAQDGEVTRKRLVRYSTLAAAASFGIAVTYWIIRTKRAIANEGLVSERSA